MGMADLGRRVARGELDPQEFKKTTGDLRSAMMIHCELLNGSCGQ